MRRAIEFPHRQSEEGIQGVMKLLLLLLCSAFYALAVTMSVNAQETSALTLSVSLSKKGGERYVLELLLKNTSTQEVTIQNLDLPWIPPNEVILVNKAYRADKANSPLEKFGPMADYMNVPHVLSQDQSLRGEIDLSVMLPTFAEDVRKYGVTVEWTCRSKALVFQCREGSGGKFIIPSKSKHKKTVPPIAPSIK